MDELLALDAELAELRLADSEAERLRVEATELRRDAAEYEALAPEFARKGAPAFALKLRSELDRNLRLRSRVEPSKPLDSANVIDNSLVIRTDADGRFVGLDLPLNVAG